MTPIIERLVRIHEKKVPEKEREGGDAKRRERQRLTSEIKPRKAERGG
jgi:hypothetical protein